VATLTVANIDKIVPNITASNGSSTTSSVTVNAVASDAGGSGLNTGSYQYSKDNGATWTVVTSATSYTFSSITTGTYQCRVKVADNVLNSTISSAVAITTQGVGTITLAANPTGWTTGNVTVTVTYPSEAITKQYSTNGTTWFAYTAAVIVTTNSTIYAKGLDAGGNQILQASLTIINIDKTAPSVGFGTNGGSNITEASTTVTVSDVGGSGINASTLEYAWDTQNVAAPTLGWGTFVNASAIANPGPGTFYLWIKGTDNAGNSIISKSNAFVTTEPIYNFSYTGNYQTWSVPYTGVYKLELWGAGGGADSTSIGTTGGYSYGEYTLTKGQNVYIYVGGQGAASTSGGGGYNGGGNAGGSSGAGGGATDIRINGLALENRIVVAGGGGGAGHQVALLPLSGAGAGGGLTGGIGYATTEATQTTYGTSVNGNGSLGQGANHTGDGGGGGGGYYGGGAGTADTGGGGGSGYVGGITNGTTQTSLNAGNGIVKITYTPMYNFSYTGNYQTWAAPYTGVYKLELWGAGGGFDATAIETTGGYSYGEYSLTKGQNIYIYVGGKGASSTHGGGGFNGGGNAGTSSGAGGGATDIRINGLALNNRIIVAGGGGGAGNQPWLLPLTGAGTGGGLTGGIGYATTGATQSTYGTSINGNGSLGQGGNHNADGGGGGGGYYGGGAGVGDTGGGGGSGYIGGVSNGTTQTSSNIDNGTAKIKFKF